jgi:MYXO-CTERM domain-containing protein
MKTKLLCGALLLAPTLALASPFEPVSITTEPPSRGDSPRPDYGCNAGGEGALLVGLIGIALIARRRDP